MREQWQQRDVQHVLRPRPAVASNGAHLGLNVGVTAGARLASIRSYRSDSQTTHPELLRVSFRYERLLAACCSVWHKSCFSRNAAHLQHWRRLFVWKYSSSHADKRAKRLRSRSQQTAPDVPALLLSCMSAVGTGHVLKRFLANQGSARVLAQDTSDGVGRSHVGSQTTKRTSPAPRPKRGGAGSVCNGGNNARVHGV